MARRAAQRTAAGRCGVSSTGDGGEGCSGAWAKKLLTASADGDVGLRFRTDVTAAPATMTSSRKLFNTIATAHTPELRRHDVAAVHARLDALCVEGWALWERFDTTVRARGFHPFVAADYDVVRAALVAHRAPGQRFLEWGSATGVITIMADLLGFEACGIELDGALVRTARALATRFDSRAQFVTGSFLPTGYRWTSKARVSTDVPDDAQAVRTGVGPSGYLQLGRALDDFDVVFGYPWGGEAHLMLDLMQRYGRRDAVLLLHDTIDGVRAYRDGRRVVVPVVPRDTPESA